MSIIKTMSVGDGDMFYIKHGSDNFTVIDCNIDDSNKKEILDEIEVEKRGKNICRFISTHPDNDHIRGLDKFDDEFDILNFYCVENQVTKAEPTKSFTRYCKLRDSDKAFYIYKGCSRKWMNTADDNRGSAGINILWPDVNNKDYKEALQSAADGNSPNNISPIIKYSLKDSVSMMWMGDLETAFMEKIQEELNFSQIDILFAPHHGRDSGYLPKSILDQIDPRIIVIGEAPSQHLNYYQNYKTITQNSTGDITFDCSGKDVHIYISDPPYSVDYLADKKMPNTYGYYIGTLKV